MKRLTLAVCAALVLCGCCAPPACTSPNPLPYGVSAFLDADGTARFYNEYTGSIYVHRPVR